MITLLSTAEYAHIHSITPQRVSQMIAEGKLAGGTHPVISERLHQ